MQGKISDFIHTAEFYESVNGDYIDDLDFYSRECKSQGGKVLELCCGTGRLTIPLFENGVDIEGLDLSSSMLDCAKKKAKEKNLDINFYHQNMLDFTFSRKYDVIMLPFNSMQCIYSTAEVEKLLLNIRKHLIPNGKFIFDVYNPSIELMVDRLKQSVEIMRGKREDGIETIIKESSVYDSALQINRAKWHVKIGGLEATHQLDTRCFYPQELDVILKYNGFNLLNKYGDFSYSKFTSQSLKQVCVCSLA